MSHHVEWDGFLARTVGGDLVQSSAWARIKQTSGMEVHRVIVRQDGAIVGGVQLLARRVPILGAVAYAPYGPVVAPGASDDAVALLVEELRGFCRVAAVRALFVQLAQGDGSRRRGPALGRVRTDRDGCCAALRPFASTSSGVRKSFSKA